MGHINKRAQPHHDRAGTQTHPPPHSPHTCLSSPLVAFTSCTKRTSSGRSIPGLISAWGAQSLWSNSVLQLKMTRALYRAGGRESTWPIFPIFHLLLFENKASLEKEQWKQEPCFSKWDQRGVGLVLIEIQNLRSHTRPAEKDPTFNKMIYLHIQTAKHWIEPWFSNLAAYWNHLGRFKKILIPGSHPPEILISLVVGGTWALEYSKAPPGDSYVQPVAESFLHRWPLTLSSLPLKPLTWPPPPRTPLPYNATSFSNPFSPSISSPTE